MLNPFISIIVPVYNASMFLERCIKSLREQTYSNLEIILVDDGSVDDSLKICEMFAETDTRVSVMHQENVGVSAARNKGLEHARGKYVAFVDADDWIDSNACETFVRACEKQNYDLFCFSAVYRSPQKSVESFLFANDIELFSQEQKEELLCKVMTPWAPWYSFNCNTRFAGSVWAKFYRTEVLKTSGVQFSPETIVSEDVLFNVLSFDSFDKIGYSAKTFYHYQVQDNSAQNRYRPNSIKYFEFVIDQIQNWLDGKKRNQRVRDCANTLFVHYLFGTLKEDYFHKDNLDSKQAYLDLKEMLNQDKYQKILKKSSGKCFSLQERLLILLMRLKSMLVITFILRMYGKFSNS